MQYWEINLIKRFYANKKTFALYGLFANNEKIIPIKFEPNFLSIIYSYFSVLKMYSMIHVTKEADNEILKIHISFILKD